MPLVPAGQVGFREVWLNELCRRQILDISSFGYVEALIGNAAFHDWVLLMIPKHPLRQAIMQVVTLPGFSGTAMPSFNRLAEIARVAGTQGVRKDIAAYSQMVKESMNDKHPHVSCFKANDDGHSEHTNAAATNARDVRQTQQELPGQSSSPLQAYEVIVRKRKRRRSPGQSSSTDSADMDVPITLGKIAHNLRHIEPMLDSTGGKQSCNAGQGCTYCIYKRITESDCV